MKNRGFVKQLNDTLFQIKTVADPEIRLGRTKKQSHLSFNRAISTEGGPSDSAHSGSATAK